MMREKSYLFAMNGGEVSPLALGRVDLSRMRISAEVMKNCFPRVIGPMAARPGLAYLSSTDGDGAACNIPFVFSAQDTALVELSDRKLRVRVAGELVSRASVSTVIGNGDFSSSTGWTLTTTGGGVSTISGGVLTLQTPNRGGTTLARRSATVSGGDQNVEHGVEITVDRGPVKFRCGTSAGGDDYIRETELKTGFHCIAFTPVTGTVHVWFSCESEAQRIVSNIVIASSGTMQLTTPWAADDLFKLRYAQSGDVIFMTSSDQAYQPMRIERRAETSWSLTEYAFTDGPFRGKTADITMTPSVRTGNGTLREPTGTRFCMERQRPRAKAWTAISISARRPVSSMAPRPPACGLPVQAWLARPVRQVLQARPALRAMPVQTARMESQTDMDLPSRTRQLTAIQVPAISGSTMPRLRP